MEVVIDAGSGGRRCNVGQFVLRHDAQGLQLADVVVHVGDDCLDSCPHAWRGHLQKKGIQDFESLYANGAVNRCASRSPVSPALERRSLRCDVEALKK
jgi:hypothetical protein